MWHDSVLQLSTKIPRCYPSVVMQASWWSMLAFCYYDMKCVAVLYSLFICACVSIFQVYDLCQVPSWSALTSTTTLFIGAGAGPSHVIGTVSEVCIFLQLFLDFYNDYWSFMLNYKMSSYIAAKSSKVLNHRCMVVQRCIIQQHDVIVGNITLLWFLLLSIRSSLQVAINTYISCSFVHL